MSPEAESAAQRACEAALQHGSRSFFWASRLLPQRLRGAAAAIYAFCREADDLIDLPPAPGAPPPLQALQARLDRVYGAGAVQGPVEQALQQVVRRHALPRALFAALCDGFAWDREARVYDSLEALQAYAARVAGSVGVLMTLVMGERRPAVLARAADLGIAMQLTNIARDVGEDAARGRLYLPHAWLRDVGLSPQAFVAAPQDGAALQAVVQRLLQEAERLYRRSEVGIAYLPRDCRGAIYAARLIYSRIGDQVWRQRAVMLQRRAQVPWWRKLWLLLRSSAAWLWRPRPNGWPVLPACAFLVAAAAPPRRLSP